MKKLLFVIPTLSAGGAERFVSNLSNYLVTQGYHVRILVFEKSKPYYALDSRIEVKTLGCNIDRTNKLKSRIQILWNIFYKLILLVNKEIKKYVPDIVLPFLPQADIVTFLATPLRKDYIVICSERNDPSSRSKIMKIIIKNIYKNVDWLVCQSYQVADYYEKILKNKKVIIENPIVRELIPEFILNESGPRIIGAGRLDDQKNFTLLINSFADAYSHLPFGTTLTIYGEGPQRIELERLIKKRKLEKIVNLPGLDKDFLKNISDAALFILSSNFEGFPNVLLETMVLGLPVISTDFSTGVAQMLIKDDNGIIIPVGNRKKLTEAIIEIMSDKERRKRIRLKNRSLINLYSIEMIGKKWELLFSK